MIDPPGQGPEFVFSEMTKEEVDREFRRSLKKKKKKKKKKEKVWKVVPAGASRM